MKQKKIDINLGMEIAVGINNNKKFNIIVKDYEKDVAYYITNEKFEVCNIKDEFLNPLRKLEGDAKYHLYSLNALNIEKALADVMTPATPYVRKDDSEEEYDKETEENSVDVSTRIQSFSFLLLKNCRFYS